MFQSSNFHLPKHSTGQTPPDRRALGFETLENREMLSVSPLTASLAASVPVAAEYDYRDSDWFEQMAGTASIGSETEGTIENEWIVQLTDEALSTLYSVSVAADHFDNYGITVFGGLGSAGALHIGMADGTSQRQNEVLAGLNCFEYWEQNCAWVNDAVSINDTYASYQWYLDTLGVESAWDQSITGSGVVVAVMDTGVQSDHPDIQTNLWTNTGETPGNGVDDDNNGFIDDYYGWNSDTNTGNVTATHEHGLAVSGVIAAVSNNNYGTAGIAPGAKILTIKAGENSFSADSVIAGINYAVKLKTDGVNIRVLNASFSGIRDSKVFASAIENALEAEILIVTSAGNDAENNDLQGNYNNRYDNVIVVASTDRYDKLSSFSNYGAVSVDLAAPGSAIYTSYFTSAAASGVMNASGTSYSAPMVSAAAALIAQLHDDWSVADIKEAILATVDPLTSLAGKVATGGRLNIAAAVSYLRNVVPAAPSNLSALLLADGTIELRWTDNSRNETGFELEYSFGGGAWTTAVSGIARNAVSTIYTPSGTGSFRFRIKAVNDYGDSDWSTEVSIQNTLTAPSTPTGLSASTTSSSIKLAWNAVSGVTAYRLERSTTGSGDWQTVQEGTQRSFTDTDIRGSVHYYYRVLAISGQAASAPSGILYQQSPTLVPDTPMGLTVSGISSTHVSLIWYDSQYATQYVVQRRALGQSNWSTIATTTVATYTNYTVAASTQYSYRIVARSGTQSSEASDILICRTSEAKAPVSAPSSLTAVAESDKIVRLSWSTVADAASYVIERSTDGTTWKKIVTVKNATTYQNKSLTAATTYFYRVSSFGRSVTTEPGEVVTVTTPLATSAVPTVTVHSKTIGTVDAGTLTITPTKTTPSTGFYYYIEYTNAVDAKNKPDWSRSIIEKVSGTTHQLGTMLTPGTQYFVRIVATETDYALDSLPAWSSLSNVGIGKETKFKTKAVPLAKITTTGFTISDGGFGAKIRITTPEQNDNAKNPVLPAGTTFSYQLIVAGTKAKTDKTTGLLVGGINFGTITLTETTVKNKTYFDSSIILFSDLARIAELETMKNVQIQLLVTYTVPGSDTPIAAVATKVARLALPKWFA